MRPPRIDIATIRKEQIVDAAVTVIAEQGIQNLSLSEIEKKVGMSRGQLTYYFKAKEEILLAVFDRLVFLMCRQRGEDSANGPDFEKMNWLEVVEFLLRMLLAEPQPDPEFHALQYTFLSQIGHRPDFRERLANLYEEWRGHLTEHLRRDVPGLASTQARVLATLVQAILHGLMIQKTADPSSINVEETIAVCLDLLRTYAKKYISPERKPHARDAGLPAPARL